MTAIEVKVFTKLMACRVADACDHAEHAAQLEIGGAIPPRVFRLPSSRSSRIEPARTI